jgi:hypothetical protein
MACRRRRRACVVSCRARQDAKRSTPPPPQTHQTPQGPRTLQVHGLCACRAKRQDGCGAGVKCSSCALPPSTRCCLLASAALAAGAPPATARPAARNGPPARLPLFTPGAPRGTPLPQVQASAQGRLALLPMELPVHCPNRRCRRVQSACHPTRLPAPGPQTPGTLPAHTSRRSPAPIHRPLPMPPGQNCRPHAHARHVRAPAPACALPCPCQAPRAGGGHFHRLRTRPKPTLDGSFPHYNSHWDWGPSARRGRCPPARPPVPRPWPHAWHSGWLSSRHRSVLFLSIGSSLDRCT